MNTTTLQQDILQKREKLNTIKDRLKQEFIGLNQVIDEVFNLISPWYLFPEAQLRPTIINMWGLTGSGKTALVKRIFELLEHQRLFVQLDMGEFESDSASWIKDLFSNELEFFHEKPGVICLDEFQFARTINKDGDELGKDKLRVVWDMLDSGSVSYIPYQNSYYMLRANLCLLLLSKCASKGMTIRNGIVETGVEEFILNFSDFYFEDHSRYGEAVNEKYFLSKDFMEGLFYLFDHESYSRTVINQCLSGASLQDIQQLLQEAVNKRTAYKQIDLSRSLFFVLGNLDEAYYMSDSLNPDISADDLYESTCTINISDIKKALRKRFRNEQIARLGNNHIIFRSFTKQHYREIIQQKLTVVSAYVFNMFGVNVCFDESVIDIVYDEGVFPAQGTRPVFTTIKNLIDGNVGKMILYALEQNWKPMSIQWRYANLSFHFTYFGLNQSVLGTLEEKLSLKMDALRRCDNPNVQAHTAVHEAGHAIIAALVLRIVPALVVSKTASPGSEGFCWVNTPEGPFTRELLFKDMVIGLGGYVAEKMIFGEEHTSSGVSKDIERVSALANEAIKEYAMGSDPIYIRYLSSSEEGAMLHNSVHTEEALLLIRKAEKQATEILEKNKLLLLKMSEYLTYHSRLEEPHMKEMIIAYAAEPWVKKMGFVNKKAYHNYADILLKQLDDFEEKSLPTYSSA